MRRRRRRKGVFAGPGLPVASRYPTSAPRRRLWLFALLAAGFVGALFALDLGIGDARRIANGPLSSAHAMLDSDCAACHDQARVSAERCSVCHEKYGDRLGVYSFAAHAVYRSQDFSRIAEPEHDVTCVACHFEHRGREAQITAVPDARCERCHEIRSFNRDHPQFDITATGGDRADERADERTDEQTDEQTKVESGTRFASDARGLEQPGLAFPHILHTAEVMKRQQLVDVERACLYCHNARADGRSFEAVSFDRHCDACHLTVTEATPELPVRADGSPPTAADAPLGVETLESLQERRPPGSLWTLTANPREFRLDRLPDGEAPGAGRVVSKSPLYHRDPWILENLRQLRQRLYPNAGLADLLVASPEASPQEVTDLYREAVATLRAYALELRAAPQRSVQRELVQVEALLDRVEQALEDPYTPLDESRFLLDLLAPDPSLSEAQRAQITELVDLLTQPCQQCHRVDRATIARVATDQRSMRRAEFDHRAHIIQRRCLDCHDRIPFEERLERAGDGKEALLDPAVDRAELVNLPSIETCQECHNTKTVANQCVTCHLFHPNKSRRSELLLYLAEP